MIGEFSLDEKSKPEITKLVAGDVLHIDADSYITWSSPNKGRGKLNFENVKDVVCPAVLILDAVLQPSPLLTLQLPLTPTTSLCPALGLSVNKFVR